MKIWDTFPFRDELDILKCRLTELEDTPVWRHVLVEATVDHQGRPKPLVFAEHKDEFAAWYDRIIHVVVDSLPRSPNPWVREHAQREHSWRGLDGADPGDVVLHSDVDEIPSAETISRAADPGGGIKFAQRCFVFAVDWELPWPWTAPVAARLAHIGSFAQFRDAHLPAVPGGGWHLSWLGGNEAIEAKRQAYCHTEMDDYIIRGLKEGQFYERGIFWGHGQGDTQLQAVDVDESWPRWVYERKCPAAWFRPRGEST